MAIGDYTKTTYVNQSAPGISATRLNNNEDKTKELDTAMATKAPLASPTFTGTPTAPTATAGTSTTQIATTAFVTAQVGKVGTKTVDETNIQSGYLLYYDGTNVAYHSQDFTPPTPVTSFALQAGNTTITPTWTNPTDTDFAGVRLVYKTGSYPSSITDGTIITSATSGTAITGLTNGTTYYVRVFTYDTSYNYNTTTSGQQLTATPVAYLIYGIRIDTTNNNPSTAVTYTDDATSFTGGESAWDNRFPFKNIKPCMLLNGSVNYYLNPLNYAQKADGTTSDISSGSAGDVMVEIPKMAYSIVTSGNYIYVKVTDNPSPTNGTNEDWVFHAHTRSTAGDRANLYIGAYLSYYDGSSKLRSLSAKTPTANMTIGTTRTRHQANGSGYDTIGFYQLTLLQVLYLIKYKNLNSQTALGMGWVNQTSSTATGGTNSSGMYFGEATGQFQMKFAGIEDFWGNLYCWIDGLYCNSTRNILTAFTSFNDTGSGYADRGQGTTADGGDWMRVPQGTSNKGFIFKTGGGSSSTYYADYADLSASSLPIFGGSWGDGSAAGAFLLNVDSLASSFYSFFGGRLMKL